jgi:hypothetical protein
MEHPPTARHRTQTTQTSGINFRISGFEDLEHSRISGIWNFAIRDFRVDGDFPDPQILPSSIFQSFNPSIHQCSKSSNPKILKS